MARSRLFDRSQNHEAAGDEATHGGKIGATNDGLSAGYPGLGADSE